MFFRHRSFSAAYGSVIFGLLAVTAAALSLPGCIDFPNVGSYPSDVGGYEDVVLDMPFADGYLSFCTQGAHGSYSHQATSTEYDIDLDTPNGANDLVYAPIGGVAFVHTESSSKNFGYHLNIDRGNGTYVVIAHLSDIFIEDGSEVAAGQIIGFEGCTGSCSGDHVHIGLHEGEATAMAEFGHSQSVSYYLDDATGGVEGETITSEDFICDGSAGHVYGSRLPVGSWHPNGSLVKTPDDANVYLIENGTRRWIETEEVFWDLGYDFRDVALISEDELDCYDVGSTIVTADSMPSEYQSEDGSVVFHEGDLVKEETASDVYAISDGVAMPIESYDLLLKLGWGSRSIVTIADGELSEVIGRVGDCTANYECVDQATIETCATGEAVDLGEGGVADGGTEEEETNDENENEDTSSMSEGEIDDGLIDDGLVEICYLPGLTMLGGELYLDGGFFTRWDSDPADSALFGDSQMCATVEAVSGEEVKMNAWFMPTSTSTVEWAAFNNECASIDWQGEITVDGLAVTVVTAPWSAAAWATDPCNTGGDAFFNVP